MQGAEELYVRQPPAVRMHPLNSLVFRCLAMCLVEIIHRPEWEEGCGSLPPCNVRGGEGGNPPPGDEEGNRQPQEDEGSMQLADAASEEGGVGETAWREGRPQGEQEEEKEEEEGGGDEQQQMDEEEGELHVKEDLDREVGPHLSQDDESQGREFAALLRDEKRLTAEILAAMPAWSLVGASLFGDQE